MDPSGLVAGVDTRWTGRNERSHDQICDSVGVAFGSVISCTNDE